MRQKSKRDFEYERAERELEDLRGSKGRKAARMESKQRARIRRQRLKEQRYEDEWN